MNPIPLAALLLAASLPLAAAQQRDACPVSGFDAVALSAPVELTLVQGDAEGLVLEGDEADLARIGTVVEDGTLRIRSRERFGASIFRSKVHGTVKARNVRAVSVAGSGDVRYYGDPALGKSVLGSGPVRRAGPSPS